MTHTTHPIILNLFPGIPAYANPPNTFRLLKALPTNMSGPEKTERERVLN